MLGLSVLLGIALFIVLALFVAAQVKKRTNSTFAKYAVLVVFALIPTWDLVPGQLYHQHLCQTEGGVRVFKTIEVEKEYFLPNGQPDEKKIREQLLDHVVGEPDRAFSRLFHITRDQTFLVDKQTRERLGTAIDFWYYGGWFMASLLPLGSSTMCPQDPKFGFSGSLLREVVRPQADAHLGGR